MKDDNEIYQKKLRGRKKGTFLETIYKIASSLCNLLNCKTFG